jgi:hypothetical protein
MREGSSKGSRQSGKGTQGSMASSAAQDGAEREGDLLATSAGKPPERHSGAKNFCSPARLGSTGPVPTKTAPWAPRARRAAG